MKTLLIVCGGPSAEHEISLLSAVSIREALHQSEWTVRTVRIGMDSVWVDITEGETPCVLSRQSDGVYQVCDNGQKYLLDAVFPIVHGPYGEDGVLQGFLEMLDVPYVGSGVYSSALNMDKAEWKEKAQLLGWSVVPWLTYEEPRTPSYDEASQWLGSSILFVKPARLGSSLGISRTTDAASFDKAIKLAYSYDSKIVVEKGLNEPRELECSVLGYPEVMVSSVMEIFPSDIFYSFEAKYENGGPRVQLPADIDWGLSESIRELSRQAFHAFHCHGLVRVDFLLEGEKLYVSEMNTLPGFTNMSGYPKMMEHAGVSYQELIERLLRDAKRRHDNKKRPDYTRVKQEAETTVARAS